jgi:phage terminase large subunit GpA-like protein
VTPALQAVLDIDRRTQVSFKRPKPRLVWQWAEANRRIERSETARPGRYRVATAPYQKEPQESFTDPAVQTTVLYWAKRLGKTEIMSNLHGATIDENPRNVLHVMPTLASIAKWSKQFLSKMIQSTPALKDKVSPARSRDSGNTIMSKEFPGGAISGIGSNSPSGFRQVQAPVVTCDEVDAMDDGPEGDPVFLGFGRAENYEDSVQVVASTATRIVPKPKRAAGEEESKRGDSTGSRIHDWWLKSDQRKWFAKCPDCRARHVLDWANVKWPKEKLADGAWEHLPEQAYYECPDCRSHWDDAKRVAAVCAGEWRATEPFKGVRGYWLNGLNTTFSPKKGYKSKLHQFASEYLDALQSGEAAFTVWKNTFLCQPIEVKAEAVDPKPLLERRENYTPQTLPNGCVLVTVAVDVQGDRLEFDAVGHGADEETWALEHRQLKGDPERDEVWRTLTGLVHRTYQRLDGLELKVSCVAVDLGFKPKRVRAWMKSCGMPRVYGVFGTSSAKQLNLVLPRYSKHYGAVSYSINTDLAKDTLFARLKLAEMGPRYMHFGREKEGFDAAYFDQLTAEERRVKYVRGFPFYYYEKLRERNEALDQRVYHLGALDILRPNVKAVEENLLRSQPAAVRRNPAKEEPQAPAPAEPKPEVKQPTPARSRRVVGGRRGAFQSRVHPGTLGGLGFGNLGAGSFKI